MSAAIRKVHTNVADLDVRPATAAGDVSDLEFSVSAVARRLGIAPATLRTWDRRYGLGPRRHVPGKHRRYSARDVARLELMHQALAHGASPADAARRAISAAAPEPAGAAPPPARIPRADDDHAPAGGVLRMPGAGRGARGLARAVLAMDGRTAQQLLLADVERVGVVATWDGMVRPVLVAVAERWVLTGAGIELEHLLSEAVTTAMARVVSDAPPPVSTRSVMLGSMPGDDHFLPARVLAATLAGRGVATSVLGADLPVHAVVAAVTRTAPAAVFLWAQLPEHADVESLAQLPQGRPRTRYFVGGPGWDPAVLPASITAISSLQDAGTMLSAAAGV